MSTKLMKCGHSANAKKVPSGEPCCSICFGIKEGADEIAEEQPNLVGRKAKCCYGPHKIVDSSLDLAFFEYLPEHQYDRYYCGCYGWD